MKLDEAIERYLLAAGISAATRRAYASDLRDFAALVRRTTARGGRRARAGRLHGRARSRARRAASSRRRRSRATSRRSGRCCVSRSGPDRVPDATLAPAPARRLPDAPKLERGRARCSRASATAMTRSPSATARSSSSSTRPDCAAPKRSGSTSAMSTSSRSTSTSARQGREGTRRPARRGGGALGRPLPARGAARARPRRRAARSFSRPVAAGSTPRRFAGSLPHPHAPPRLRNASARGRRRPARHPGAPRPREPLDDPDLQPRRAPKRLRRVYDRSHPAPERRRSGRDGRRTGQ